MSAWPGKYVIGLTGNIATGKSVVRKMLEHLSAYGIDADALGHPAIAKGAPGYQPVLEMFGKWILGPGDQIDRGKLAQVVFADPQALLKLESIVHPLVGQALDILIRRSKHTVIIIEAIKLIESGLGGKSDTIWATFAPGELQLARLMQRRGMSESSARQRINAQSIQEQKTAAAQVVIQNDGSFENTWNQVNNAWQSVFPSEQIEDEISEESAEGEYVVQRGRPGDATEIAELISKLSDNQRQVNRDDIMAAFGEKAFMLLKIDGNTVGLVGWKVENLVARTDDFYLKESISLAECLGPLMDEVERASQELQCEISLLFLSTDYEGHDQDFRRLGYQQRTIDSLGIRAWEEAAQDSMKAGNLMLFKQLRHDRVLRPV